MNKHRKHKISATVAIVTLLLVAIGAEAGTRGFRNRESRERYRRARVENTFTISGTFIGTLDGRIRVGNEHVYIAPGTPVYVRNHGVKETGYFVNDASVFIACTLHEGSARATYVVVQPEEPSSERTRTSKNEREFLIKSDTNRETGEYKVNIPG